MSTITNHKLSEFINAFKGGLRPNRFTMFFSPDIAPLTTILSKLKSDADPHPGFFIRAASLPQVTTTPIELPYRGRVYKIPGQRTFATWEITVLDDTNNLWAVFMNWANTIQSNVDNTTAAATTWASLMCNATVQQLNFNGVKEKEITLFKTWPSEISEVKLSQDDPESLCSFNVKLEYQYISDF